MQDDATLSARAIEALYVVVHTSEAHASRTDYNITD
jgi:hypothetical protein